MKQKMPKTISHLKTNKYEICISIFLFVVIAANILLFGLENKYDLQIDCSSDNRYTLSDTTKDIITDLKQQINIYTLYSPGNDNSYINLLLDKFSSSCSNLSVFHIDPSSTRAELSAFEKNHEILTGSIVVSNQEQTKYKILSSSDLYFYDNHKTYCYAESKISAAIEYVANGNIRRALFLSGHQEEPFENMSKAISHLSTLNYDVQEYSLLNASEPLDPTTDILLCVSPKQDISKAEKNDLADFLSKKGILILLIDRSNYDSVSGNILASPNQTPILDSLLKKYGLFVNYNVIASADTKHTSLRPTTIELSSEDSAITAVISESAEISVSPASSTEYTTLFQTPNVCFTKNINAPAFSSPPGASLSSYPVGVLAKQSGEMILLSSSSFLKDCEIDIENNSAILSFLFAKTNISPPSVSIPPVLIKEEISTTSSPWIKIAVLLVLFSLPVASLFIGRTILRKRKKQK